MARPLLTDDDIYLFNEGSHFQLYDHLGAHPRDGGYHFAVWAPSAKTVSLVGDFNGHNTVTTAKISIDRAIPWGRGSAG